MTREEISQYIKSELANEDAEIYLDVDDYKVIVEALEQKSNEDAVKKMFASGLLKDCEMCKVMQESMLDKIRAEIETQEKWLAQAGYNAYNVDMAFRAIKLALAECEGER